MKINRNIYGGILSIALFNFVFLGTEYMYDNMMMYVTDAGNVVTAQNYVLGISVIGFLLFPVVNRIFERYDCCIINAVMRLFMIAAGIACICLINIHASYGSVLAGGCVVFVMLGIVGSEMHYILAKNIDETGKIPVYIGIAYALGIALQFINNNLVNNDKAEAIVLGICYVIIVVHGLYCRISDAQRYNTSNEIQRDGKDAIQKPAVAAAALIVTVLFMTCIFSTLDNAVTIVHANGSVDIGQWPRIMLALSGLAAVVLYNIADGKYMNIIMYCVTLLSVICVVVIVFGGPFIAGLLAFYMSAGFFVVYFTTTFMRLSYYLKVQPLWAGLGRAVNNIAAVIMTYISIKVLEQNNEMALIISALILFTVISISMYIYSQQINKNEEIHKELKHDLINDDNDKLQMFSEYFHLTSREKDVLQALLSSEENVSKIADSLYMSRTALYNHISSINDKTATSKRMGLIQFYYAWKM